MDTLMRHGALEAGPSNLVLHEQPLHPLYRA